MIVKNEAKVIRRCLDAAKPFLDTWVIVDTGSTDGTQDIIREHLHDIPGELFERPWRNFGHNRTEAIRLAEGRADYLLLCDADMALVAHDTDWKRQLSADAYLIRQRHGTHTYSNIRLINARTTGDKRWRYWGATHEYVDCVRPGAPYRKETLQTIEFIDYADGGSKSEKFERDARLLVAEIADIAALECKATQSPGNEALQQAVSQQRPLMVRDTFYLAQTFRDAGKLEESLAAYQRRAGMGGWSEEVWYSLYEVAKLSERLALAPDLVTQRYLDAYEARPARAETLVQLARWHRERGKYALAFLFAEKALTTPRPADILFVDEAAYGWQALDEYAIASYWIGNYEACRDACEKLLAGKALPEQHRARVTENLRFARAGMVTSRSTGK